MEPEVEFARLVAFVGRVLKWDQRGITHLA